MSKNITIEKVLDGLSQIFQMTDTVLNEWGSSEKSENLQFPVLLGMIALRMNWDEKQTREADPFVRKYVRSHSDWTVTRGAHGGIMKTSDKLKKEELRAAKDAAKKKMIEAIEAVASATQTKESEVETSIENDTEES